MPGRSASRSTLRQLSARLPWSRVHTPHQSTPVQNSRTQKLHALLTCAGKLSQGFEETTESNLVNDFISPYGQ